MDRISDPNAAALGSVWDTEWQEHLIAVALVRLKRKVKLKHYQIFFLHVIKGQSVRDVAESLGVNVAQVYLVKHRLARQFKEEIDLLKREME